MRKIILNVTKIILSIITIPLWFIHYLHDSGIVMEPTTNKLVEVVFKHNMFENMESLGCSFMFYVSIVVVIGSVVLSVISIKTTDKKIHNISNIVSIITIVLFIICLIVSSTVDCKY